MSGETALYRHFDEGGELLYVGISSSVIQRLAQHSRHTKWARRIARVDVEYYESREAAEAAERSAIRAERPLWNIAYNASSNGSPDRRLGVSKTGAGAVVAEQIAGAAMSLADIRGALDFCLMAAIPVSEREVRFFFTTPLPEAALCRVNGLMDMPGIPGIGFHFLTGVNADESEGGEGFFTLSTPLALEEKCLGTSAWGDSPVPAEVMSATGEYATAFRELLASCPEQSQQPQHAAT